MIETSTATPNYVPANLSRLMINFVVRTNRRDSERMMTIQNDDWEGMMMIRKGWLNVCCRIDTNLDFCKHFKPNITLWKVWNQIINLCQQTQSIELETCIKNSLINHSQDQNSVQFPIRLFNRKFKMKKSETLTDATGTKFTNSFLSIQK